GSAVTRVVARLRGALVSASTSLLPALALGQSDDDGGWYFDEIEEADPTLLELAADQAWDIGLFAAFATLAMLSFFRKSVRLKYVTLVIAVLYMGVYKSQLMSIVNVFGVLTANLPIFSYNMGWYAFAIFTAATTLLW